jgi:hypothetical protein
VRPGQRMRGCTVSVHVSLCFEVTVLPAAVMLFRTSWTQYPRHAATFVNLWCIDH